MLYMVNSATGSVCLLNDLMLWAIWKPCVSWTVNQCTPSWSCHFSLPGLQDKLFSVIVQCWLIVTFQDSISVPPSCLILGDGTDRLSWCICKYHSTPRNIPEEQRPHLHHGRNLKSFMVGSWQ